MDELSWVDIIIRFLPLIVAVVVHEVAHAWVADKLGDNTARSLGRITLNPLKHIDLFMTIIIPGILILSKSPVIFGGAKPVPVNVYNFKNPKRDMAIVAAAGPASNFILATIGLAAMWGWKNVVGPGPEWAISFLIYWVLINIVLAVFNLFPIPPLDGGRIMVGLLPQNLAVRYARLERFGFMILVFLLFSGVINSYLTPVIENLLDLISYVLAN